jgi:uncharacterized protein YutD
MSEEKVSVEKATVALHCAFQCAYLLEKMKKKGTPKKAKDKHNDTIKLLKEASRELANEAAA